MVAAREGDPFGEGDIWPEAVVRKGGSYRLLATMPSRSERQLRRSNR